MKKKKGFTLTELLAVIVILTLIGLIAIPIILNLVYSAKKQAFRESVISAFGQLNYYLTENNLAEIPEEGVDVLNIGLKENSFKYGVFNLTEEGKVEVINITNGEFCAVGERDKLAVFKGECDLTTPRCELKIEGEIGVGNWYRNKPIVTMRTSEAKTGGLIYGIGLKENYENSVEDGKVGEASYQTTEGVKHKVYCYVQNIGRKKGSNEIEVNTDQTAPTEVTFRVTVTSKSIRVTASATDRESGISRYQFSKDNGATWTKIQSSNVYTFDMLPSGVYSIKVRAYNGTYVEKEQEKNVYKESEVQRVETKALVAPTYDINPKGWTAGNVETRITYKIGEGEVRLFKTTVPVTINTNAVKCSRVLNGEYTCNGETTRTIEANAWYEVGEDPVITFSGNGAVIAQIVDGVNYKSASSFSIANIDKTAPTISITLKNQKSDRITVQATCADAESGITKYEYSKDGKTWVTGNAEYTFTKLTKGTNYTITGRCTNGSKLTSVASKTTATSNMTNPVIGQASATIASGYTWATSRVIKITYNNTNVVSPVYYFKSTVAATVGSGVVTGSCGTGGTPGACSNTSVTTLAANTWYRTGSTTPSITFKANGTLYAYMGDGTNLSGLASLGISQTTAVAPSISLTLKNQKSDRITAQATCTDTSGIKKYEYSKDGKTWAAGNAEYTFTKLTKGTSYTITGKCTNNAGLSSTKSGTTTTSNMANPGMAQTSAAIASGYTWATSRVIRITYNNANVASPVYYFKSTVAATVGSGVVTGACGTGGTPGACSNTSVTTLAANTWYRTGSTTPSITFKANGTLYAYMGDGTNLSGQASIGISNTDSSAPGVPTVRYNSGGNSCTWKNNYKITLSATDNHGIKTYEIDTNGDGTADQTTGASFVPWNGYSTCNWRVRAVDNAGNKSGWTGVHHIHMDTQAPGVPTVRYNSGGNSCTWKNNYNMTLSASDNVGISTYEIDVSGNGTVYQTTGASFIPPNGYSTCNWRVRAVDHAGNRSGWTGVHHVHVDQTAPGVSVSVSGKTATFNMSDNISLASYSVSTSTATPSSGWVGVSGTSASRTWTASSAGTYYVHVKDVAGNTKYASFSVAQSAFCAYSNGQVVASFNYTGGVQGFTTPCNGTYKLEVWGGQGGNGGGSNVISAVGGNGGYAYGNKTLSSGTALYIAVGGGSGNNYNGGGARTNSGGNGGGATHIATTNRGVLANYNGYRGEVIMVAGGGGGGGGWAVSGSIVMNGGPGGGRNGGNGSINVDWLVGFGGSQSSGGCGPHDYDGYGAKCGSFGTGGSSPLYSGAGGGGGWYGGGSGGNYNGSTPGGGGSGYINTSQLISGTTGMQTGRRSGNGYAQITLVSVSG